MLGVHVAKESHVLDNKKSAKDMSDAITRDADTLGINAVQIFTHGPRFVVKNKMNTELVKKVCVDLNLSVHSAYATTKIWSIETKNDDAVRKLLDQMNACKEIGAWGLVVHITKIHYKTAEAVMSILKPLIKDLGVKFVIEMVASKSDEELTYETPEKINRLTDLIGPDDWWGWCVDTAHLWGAGVNIRKYADMKKWLGKLKSPICMFHLNGSSSSLGSGKDKHEIAGGPDDLIWGSTNYDSSGVMAVVEYAKLHKIPIICEINRGSEENVNKLLDLIKDELEA
jgi:endonuclease IV